MVVFRFQSDRVLFRFLIDRSIFRILSNSIFFDLSLIDLSSVSTVMESSLGSSELFFRQVTIFSSNHGTTFLSKKDVVFFYSISLKRNLHLPIGLAKKTEEILTQNIILKIYVINFPIYKLSNGTANDQEWEDVN